MAPFRQWQLPVRKDRKGIGSLQLVTLDETPQPEAGQVLVKVKAVSLNYRDLAIVQGTYPRLVAEGKLVPVSDGAGEVVQVGSGVTLVSPGQKVMAAFNILHLHGWAPDEVEANNGLGGQIDGMLTEFKLLPESALVPMPSNMSYEEAATLPCAALTAYNSLFGIPSLALQSGQTALLEGTGGVSIFGVQLSIASGANAIITSSSDKKLEVVRSLFDEEQNKRLHTINYSQHAAWEKVVRDLTGGAGANHILDVGGTATVEKAFQSVKRGDVISNIGFLSKADTVPNVPNLSITSGAIYRSITVGSVQQLKDMSAFISKHNIRPLVDRVFIFSEAPLAYEYL